MADSLSQGSASPVALRLLTWEEFDASVAVDYHMHTIHTDGTSSVLAMAQAAVSHGIDEVLFSEHVRHTSTYYPAFVEEVRGLRLPGLSIRVGIETKVLDVEGTLDCSPEIASMCDAIVGSVHSPPKTPATPAGRWSEIEADEALEIEFELAMAIVTKSRAHILGHPMGMAVSRFRLEPLEQIYRLACACRDSDKAFELNTRYCPSPAGWIDSVQRAGCKVSFASDAHKTEDVGSAWTIFSKKRPALQ